MSTIKGTTLKSSHVETWSGARVTCGYCCTELQWEDEGTVSEVRNELLKQAKDKGWTVQYYPEDADGAYPCCPECREDHEEEEGRTA